MNDGLQIWCQPLLDKLGKELHRAPPRPVVLKTLYRRMASAVGFTEEEMDNPDMMRRLEHLAELKGVMMEMTPAERTVLSAIAQSEEMLERVK